MLARYMARRAAQSIVVLWAAYTAAFMLLYMLPGDPVAIMAGGGLAARPLTPEALEILRAEFGLDKSLPEQYWNQLTAALHGDLGLSISKGQTVSSLIGQSFPDTLRLGLMATAIALILGVGLAFGASFTKNIWLQQVIMSTPAMLISLPTFWVGLIFLQLFSFRWTVFPVGGTGGSAIVLPAVTLALPATAIIAQVLGKSLLVVLNEPFVEVAKAKGLTRLHIHVRHVFRNALGPFLAVTGLLVGTVIAGAVISETVFARNGLGRMTVEAVNARDLPVVQGVVLLSAAVFVTANLIVDLIYPMIDPRVATEVKV